MTQVPDTVQRAKWLAWLEAYVRPNIGAVCTALGAGHTCVPGGTWDIPAPGSPVVQAVLRIAAEELQQRETMAGLVDHAQALLTEMRMLAAAHQRPPAAPLHAYDKAALRDEIAAMEVLAEVAHHLTPSDHQGVCGWHVDTLRGWIADKRAQLAAAGG